VESCGRFAGCDIVKADSLSLEAGKHGMVDQNTLVKAARRLAKRFHATRIILFGSQARGTADEHSDVDLLVIAPLRQPRQTLLLEMYRELGGREFGCDLVLLSEEEYEADRHVPGTVARPAALEGKVLYECSPRV